MRHLATVLLCVIGANAVTKLQAIFQEHALKRGSECLSEGIGATMDDLKAIVRHDIPTTRAGMCLITCIHEKFGVQEPDGKISKEGFMAFLEQIKDDPAYYDVTKEHFLHCIETVPQDDEKCTIGTNLMSCLVLGGRKKNIFHE
ncbi:putative odorant binding protein [Trypoxylus dichotomus]